MLQNIDICSLVLGFWSLLEAINVLIPVLEDKKRKKNWGSTRKLEYQNLQPLISQGTHQTPLPHAKHHTRHLRIISWISQAQWNSSNKELKAGETRSKIETLHYMHAICTREKNACQVHLARCQKNPWTAVND